MEYLSKQRGPDTAPNSSRVNTHNMGGDRWRETVRERENEMETAIPVRKFHHLQSRLFQSGFYKAYQWKKHKRDNERLKGNRKRIKETLENTP